MEDFGKTLLHWRRTASKHYAFAAKWYMSISLLSILFPTLTASQVAANTAHSISQLRSYHAPHFTLPSTHGGDINDD